MPTYDYKCKKCGFIFEVIHSIKFEDKILCEKCKEETERLISGGNGTVIRDTASVANRIKKQARETQKEINKGNENVCRNLGIVNPRED